MCTPIQVVDALRQRVEAHVRERPGEFTGASSGGQHAASSDM
jgi:hypothetical protein